MRTTRRLPNGKIIFFLLWACILPGTAFGHASLHHADPKVGSTISAAPPLVRIWFDSDLEPAFSKMTVLDGGGKRVDKGDCRVDPSDPTLLEVGSQPLPPGRYKVIWDIVSRDGHRTNGDYSFTVK